MQDFSFKGRHAHFWQTTGEIIGNSKYSETRISSSGGGGYLHQGSGHVSAPTVSSRSIVNHEFWIRKDDGDERAIKLRGVDVPLREGQRVTVIAGAKKGLDDGFHSVLVNHNAKRHWYINDGQQLMDRIGLAKGFHFFWTLLVSVIIGFTLAFFAQHAMDAFGAWGEEAGLLQRLQYLVHPIFLLERFEYIVNYGLLWVSPWWFWAGAVAIPFVVKMFRHARYRKRLATALHAHLSDLANNAYQEFAKPKTSA